MILVKRLSFNVVLLICLVNSAASEDASSSSTLTSVNVSAPCTNTSDNADVCYTISEIPMSTLGEVTNSSTVSYESTYMLDASTEGFKNDVFNETVTVSNNITTVQSENGTFNTMVTEKNSTPSTDMTNIETSTKAVEVTSTPLILRKMIETGQDLFGPYGDICSCDVTVDVCDILCCCDPDCTDSDRLVFSSCRESQTFATNSRYCYQTQFVYRNNTEFKTIQSKGGMFCILENNLRNNEEYVKKDAVTFLSDLDKLVTHGFYSWKKKRFSRPEYVVVKSHKSGEIVWGLRNSTLAPLDIPVKVAGSICRAMKSVRYLEDCESDCSQIAPSSESCESKAAFNAEMYHEHLFVFSSPKTSNLTQHKSMQQNCINNSCIAVTPFLCPNNGASSSKLENCKQLSTIPAPSEDILLTACNNVVRSVRYLIRHNGTRGITNVSAFITLSNVTMLRSPLDQFVQSFGVEFIWASVRRIVPKRSGRPGYVVGKPLISGLKVMHTSNVENITGKEAIKLSYDRNDWLGVPATKANGDCDSIERHSLLFRENSQSSCNLPLEMSQFLSSAKCAAVQKTMLKFLVGDVIDNVTEAKQFNVYVATFGDSLVENAGDWVQVILETVPSLTTIVSSLKPNNRQLVCKNIITSMHIDVVFANVGSQENPQAKVLGVALRFAKPQDLEFDCDPVQCSSLSKDIQKKYSLTSSVSFVDATKAPVAHFLQPPVYEVKLPHDFFYPFFSASSIPEANFGLKIMALAFYMFTFCKIIL